MYRLNRIGQYPIVDVDKTTVSNALAVFDTVDHTINSYGYVATNLGVPPDVNSDNVIFTLAPVLLNGMSVGFGVQVNGDLTERNYHFGASAFLQFKAQTTAEFNIQLVLARVGVGQVPSLTADCPVTNPVFLPFHQSVFTPSGRPIVSCHADLAALHYSEVNPPTVQEPMALFWHIENGDGAAQATLNMRMRIALHRYTVDLDSHDPTR